MPSRFASNYGRRTLCDDCLRRRQATSPTTPTQTRNSGIALGSGTAVQPLAAAQTLDCPFKAVTDRKTSSPSVLIIILR